jgi:hypothetical protein
VTIQKVAVQRLNQNIRAVGQRELEEVVVIVVLLAEKGQILVLFSSPYIQPEPLYLTDKDKFRCVEEPAKYNPNDVEG